MRIKHLPHRNKIPKEGKLELIEKFLWRPVSAVNLTDGKHAFTETRWLEKATYLAEVLYKRHNGEVVGWVYEPLTWVDSEDRITQCLEYIKEQWKEVS